MSDKQINYDKKVQDALRQVVRDVLIGAAKDGLPGEHHFYIAFKTQSEGVSIPDHLIARFPDEMTIVIQHKYWGLNIFDDYFEIGLSFNQQPSTLVIPFAAIVGFVDPSVQFALQFQDEQDKEVTLQDNGDDTTPIVTEDSAPAAVVVEANTSEKNRKSSKPANKSDKAKKSSDPTNKTAIKGENVVTLDAFRKK